MRIPGIYRDERGSETIVFETDGTFLETTIRSVTFEGDDFDSLESEEESEFFSYWKGTLCRCKFILEIPVRLATPDGMRRSVLMATIELGAPGPRGGLDDERIQVSWIESEFSIESPGHSGWFEDELLSLINSLPEGFAMQACITCGLSDYSPYGHGSFGSLACFRDAASDYRDVDSKEGIFAVWDRLTDFVQETHLCDQYELRPKGRGYRG
ncbi:MAG: DUF6304 family protein [Acidobacteriota bacterium]